jgi:hypothetical protein
MSNIIPTIGRRVWFWPGLADTINSLMADTHQPFDAGVIFVHPDNTVNLAVTTHDGQHFTRFGVVILPADAEPNPEHSVAQWMPYQAAQAKKQEEAK